MQLSELTAKVQAVNEANAYALTVYDLVIPIFTPLVGQKVEKAGGDLLAKLQKLMPEFGYSHRRHVYKLTSPYTLGWVVKACVNYSEWGRESYAYHEVTVYVGDLKGDILTKLYPRPDVLNTTWRSDYTVEEIKDKQRKAKEAKEAYENARSDCFPFGEG